MTDEPGFTSADGIAAQKALRDTLGLGEEIFPLPAFVGMLSDEIEQLRAAGHDDDAIAAMVTEATGKTMPADAIGRFYAPPEARRHGQ